MQLMVERALQNKNSGLQRQYGTFDQIGSVNNLMTMTYDEYLQKAPVNHNEYYWGKYRTFLYYKNNPLIVIGPHWSFFLFAYSLFWLTCILMLNFEIQAEVYSFQTLGFSIAISIIQLVSYLYVSFKNPGVANQHDIDLQDPEYFQQISQIPKSNQIWYCKICKLIQGPTTRHCEFCEVCILGLDHHCPWTGKCIGQNNLISFFFFLISTILLFTTFMIATMQKQKQLSEQNNQQ